MEMRLRTYRPKTRHAMLGDTIARLDAAKRERFRIGHWSAEGGDALLKGCLDMLRDYAVGDARMGGNVLWFVTQAYDVLESRHEREAAAAD